MRMALMAIAVVVATGLVACGGDEQTAPLTMEQRILRASDLPGSKPDPVEVRLTADNLDEFAGWDAQEAEIPRDKLAKAGFVSAIHDTRFLPKEPGGAHTRDAPHVPVIVLRFRSEDGAATGAKLVYAKGLEPCPGQCLVQNEEFEVDGVPGATGYRRYLTAERAKQAKATGGPDEPFDSYTIGFTDGPFAYAVDGFAPPSKISKKQIQEIAQTVYDRVKGAPPAGK